MAVWELEDGSRSSLNYYKHDEYDHLLEKYREFSDTITSRQTYEYDEKGKLLAEHFRRSDGVFGTAAYEYDKKGKLVKAYYHNSDAWLTGTIIFSHDENGKILTGVYAGDNGSEARISFEYAVGNLLKIYWDFSLGKTQTYRFEYE